MAIADPRLFSDPSPVSSFVQTGVQGSAHVTPGLDGKVDVRGQARLGRDLYHAAAGHFDGVSALAGLISQYRNHRSFGVGAERLIDLVADGKFGGHGASSAQAVRAVIDRSGSFVLLPNQGQRRDGIKMAFP
jgi:hypothetical protein